MAGEYVWRCEKLPAGVLKETAPLVKYDTEFAWGNRNFRYDRTRSCVLYATEAQLGKLYDILYKATVASNLAICKIVDCVGEDPKPLTSEAVRELMERMNRELHAKGFDPDSYEHVAAMRAAAHTLQAAGVYLKMNQRPRIKYPVNGDLAHGLPVRLACGVMYGRPIVATGDGAGGFWLDLGAIGRVWTPGLPDTKGRGVETASYCEFTFWNQAFQLRFVFSRPLTDAEKGAAKERREKRKAKP